MLNINVKENKELELRKLFNLMEKMTLAKKSEFTTHDLVKVLHSSFYLGEGSANLLGALCHEIL